MNSFVASLIASGLSVEDYCAEKGAYVDSYAPAYDDLPTFHYIENKGEAAWNAESMNEGIAQLDNFDQSKDLCHIIASCDWGMPHYEALMAYEVSALEELKIDLGVNQKNHDGECSVMIYRHMYAGSVERVDYVRDEASHTQAPLVFASYKEAAAWIAEQEAMPYTLAHNESCAPDYVIVDAA